MKLVRNLMLAVLLAGAPAIYAQDAASKADDVRQTIEKDVQANPLNEHINNLLDKAMKGEIQLGADGQMQLDEKTQTDLVEMVKEMFRKLVEMILQFIKGLFSGEHGATIQS